MCRRITDLGITFWKGTEEEVINGKTGMFEYASTETLDRTADKFLVSDGFLIDIRYQGSTADLVYFKLVKS